MATYSPLQSIVLTSNASSVTFSGIDQTFQDLVIVMAVKQSDDTQNFLMRFNGDTGSNYSSTRLMGSGSTAYGGNTSNESALQVAWYGAPSSANEFGAYKVDINNYSSSTSYKKTLIRYGNNTGTYPGTGLNAGLWRGSTNPITSITILPASGSLLTGSTFDLYGISPVNAKNASASGGTNIYYDSSYVYHTFSGSGVFTPNRALTADILVVAGGGGSGGVLGGGGGAGSVLFFASQSLSANTSYSCTVGGGGNTGSGLVKGSNGSNSAFGSLTAAVGGGGGGSYPNATTSPGNSGGSGGGGGSYNSGGSAAGGSGSQSSTGVTAYYVNNGGAGSSHLPGGSGGGGGAGSSGNSGGGGTGGAGGSGISSITSMTGSNLQTWLSISGFGENSGGTYYIAGGGGGSGDNNGSGSGGAAGVGGGGAGITPSTGANIDNSGKSNTGGGCGGGSEMNFPTGGGSGFIIVRYAR